MNLLDDVAAWHPRLLAIELPGAQLLLLDERESRVFKHPAAAAVGQLIADGLSLQQALLQGRLGAQSLELALALMASLEQQGLLGKAQRDATALYRTPDFNGTACSGATTGGGQVISLTPEVGFEEAAAWTQALMHDAECTALTAVFCDDYLDPRLAAVNAAQLQSGKPWIIVKPTGKRWWVGPLFGVHDGGGPCWECLAHRLRRNDPARAWVQAHHGVWPSLPILQSTSGAADALKALIGPALARVRGAASGLYEHSATPLAHAVMRRPQCPQCGQPGMVAQAQWQPIRPQPCPKLAVSDGGSRAVAADQTVAQLAAHVSPLTGVVASLSPLGDADALPVYRSAIFRTAPGSAQPGSDGFVQVCLGKGMSDAQSKASALGEAIERYAAFYQGDEAIVSGAAHTLDAPAVLPRALVFFSASQKATAPPSPEPSHWVPAWSLAANERRYLPLSHCYAHAPETAQSAARWTSNGCAAGNTLEEAMLQGLLELVERDAVAVWWYNRVARPGLDPQCLPPSHQARIARTLKAPWHYWLLDLTHDFQIPVVAAVAERPDTQQWAIGFGCCLDGVKAVERATTELAQLIAVGRTLNLDPREACGPAVNFLRPIGESPNPSGPKRIHHADIAHELEYGVSAAKNLGMDVIAHDYARPDLPLRTVKITVPGLCHIWPELANPRLYNVPVALGWQSTPLTESALNPWPLYL